MKKYVNNGTERLLSSVRIMEEGKVIESEADMKKRKRTERKESWKEKTLHGQFLRQTDDIASEDRWLWLKQGNVKRETESLIFAAQEQGRTLIRLKNKVNVEFVEKRTRQ